VATGVSFTDPKQQTTTSRIMDGFVDDTTNWTNRFLQQLSRHKDPITIESIHSDLAATAQCWEKLRHTSGGKLELPKCFFYIVSWLFDSKGKVYLATGSDMGNPSITLWQSKDNTSTTIQFQESLTTHKTLGVMVDPYSTPEAELSQLLNKGKDFARQFGSGPINKWSARRAYLNIYLPSMTYSLPVTSFTRYELSTIQNAPLSVLIPAMGFNRHMPLAIKFGPLTKGGMDFRHLYAEQGSGQASMIMRHLRSKTSIGDNTLICLKWFQRLSGTSTPPLVNPSLHLPHAEGNWILSLREFLSDSHCEIIIPALKGAQTRRINDRVLMDDAITSSKYSDSDVEAINRMRLFLQVECLSEICTTMGHRILPTVWQQRSPVVPSTSLELWPIQSLPGPKTKRIWTNFLCNEYCTDTGLLRVRLGPWINTEDRT
jgi:hypothetical protein